MIRYILFFLVMIIYLWFPWDLIRQQEKILQTGVPIKMSLQPVDPYDAFRGRYIRLAYDEWEAPFREVPRRDQEVWVSFKQDSSDFYALDSVFFERPASPIALQTRVSLVNLIDKIAYLQTPPDLQYYYLNDEIAPLAESAYRDLVIVPENQDRVNAYAQIRILGGEARIEEVYIKGTPIGEYVRAQLK